MTTLQDLIERSAARHPDAPAIRTDGQPLSYSDLLSRVRKVAGALEMSGAGKGDRVAVLLPNIPEFTAVYFGILWAGGVVVPLSVLLAPGEVARAVAHAGCRLLVTDRVDGLPDDVDVWHVGRSSDEEAGSCGDVVARAGGIDPVPVTAEDTAVVFYTSGTTGAPKGAVVTHRNLTTNARWVSERSLSGDIWGQHHVTAAFLPFSHSFGQTCVQNASLLNGASICFSEPRFDAAAAMRTIDRHGVTVMAGVPSMAQAILAHPDVDRFDLTSLRYVLLGGAPIPRPLIERFEERTGSEILEGYGLSETSPVIAFRTPSTPRAWGSVGRSIDGVELRVVQEDGSDAAAGGRGEVVVKGEPVMNGYLDAPEQTAAAFADGWFRTGDIGYLDVDGNLFLVDRKKDVILRGGYTVYPAEVEKVLSTHPEIVECAVVGIPSEALGEEVAAHVVLASAVSESELIAWAKERMAGFKYPRRFSFHTSLPRGTKGQVLKQALRAEPIQESVHDSD